jgi:hypothetical protein
MAGLVPAIHVLRAKASQKGVDARDKRGHDERQFSYEADASIQLLNFFASTSAPLFNNPTSEPTATKV